MTSSADLHIRDALDAAYQKIKDSGVIDPELDLPQGLEPKWGQHSFRRHADRKAQQTKEKTKATVDEIDWLFGWRLKELRATMQNWYKGWDRRARLQLARITQWV